MQLSIVEMQGNWTRAWPSQQITLLDCSFKGDETVSSEFFIISTEVEARSDEDATVIGKARMEEACYLFGFCLGGSVRLRREQILSRPKDGHVAQAVATIGAWAALYSPNPLQPEDLRRASDIAAKIHQNPWLKRVIRWWGEGKRETDPIDRFIKFWVAFECLGKNELGEDQ